MAGFSAHLWDWWTLLHPYLPSLLDEVRERVFRFRRPPDRFVHNAQWQKSPPLLNFSLRAVGSSYDVAGAATVVADGGAAPVVVVVADAAYLAIAAEKVSPELDAPPVYVGC